MLRNCTRCRHTFQARDLNRTESRTLEHDRKEAGLEGVRFFYYHCPDCGMDDVFVDVMRRPGEPTEDYERRRVEMEDVVSRFRDERAEALVDAVVVAR